MFAWIDKLWYGNKANKEPVLRTSETVGVIPVAERPLSQASSSNSPQGKKQNPKESVSRASLAGSDRGPVPFPPVPLSPARSNAASVVNETDGWRMEDTNPVEHREHQEERVEKECCDEVVGEDVETADDMKHGITRASRLPTLHHTIGGPSSITSRIVLWEGDITKLRIDCIQNAANEKLRGGGGVDGSIHRAAGRAALQRECRKNGGCRIGNTVVTPSFGITHVKMIAHTVGPTCIGSRPSESDRRALLSCYKTTLRVALDKGCRSVALCCVSTGVYGYNNAAAARLVCEWAWKTLEEDTVGKIQLLVFCIFKPQDKEYYQSFFKQLADKDGQLEHSEYQMAIGEAREEEEEKTNRGSDEKADSNGDAYEGSRKRAAASPRRPISPHLSLKRTNSDSR